MIMLMIITPTMF